jgi:SpoVK/Ycf46/Vps4 family AAA+-type ATPase
MATNLQQNMDPAFLRRIQVVVDFPFPDADARFRIWSHILRQEIRDLDDDVLRSVARRFDLSGGGIRNVVIAAAFLAHSEGRLIGLPDLHVAIAREYRKLGRPLRQSTFGGSYGEVMTQLFGISQGGRFVEDQGDRPEA